MSNIPKPQKYIVYVTWVFAGVMLLGSFIGVINDTLDLISLPLSILGTAIIVVIYFAAQQYLRRFPWQTDTGRITRLNFGMLLPLVGMIALLWVPQILQVVPEKRYFPSEKKGESLIIVATFHRTEGVVDVDAHNEIRNSIQEKVEELNLQNVRVQLEPTIIPSNDRDLAKEVGKRYDASIIIWGTDTGVRLEVGFLNLKEPDSEAGDVTINETEKTQLAHPDAYSHFIIYELPSQLSYLALFAMGQADFANKNYGSAIDLIEEAVTELGYIPEYDADELGLDTAYFTLALSNHFIRAHHKAIDYYDSYLEHRPNNISAYLNQAAAYMATGEFDKANTNLEHALSLDPQRTSTLGNLGVLNMFIGDYVKARGYFSQALELDPEEKIRHNILFNLGVIDEQLGQYDHAKQKFEEYVAVYPEDSSAYTNLGIAKSHLGDFDNAISDFEKALSINPKDTIAYTRLASTYLNRGFLHLENEEYEKAIIDFGKHLEMNPQSPYRKDIEEIVNQFYNS